MTDSHSSVPERVDNAMLVRYLDGISTGAELAVVERWLATDPAHRAELEGLRTAWSPPAAAEADRDDAMWRWIVAQMDEPLPRPVLLPAGGTARPRLRRLGPIAAVLAVAMGGALLARLPGAGPSPRADTWASTGVGVRELATPRGARVTSNLPDGSRVTLGPDSRLRIAAAFGTGAGARDVYLQGEAFFKVTHDAKRQFRVHTVDGTVKDLGTEFVVTAYPDMAGTRTVVTSGLVALQRPGAKTAGSGATEVTLAAGDVGRLDASGAAVVARNVDVAPYVGWTEGTLVFDSVAVRDVITTLGRWYDLDIRLADSSLARRRFSATFEDEPAVQVFKVLEIALGARAQRTGQLVVLRSR